MSPKRSTGCKVAPQKLCKQRDNGTCLLTGFSQAIEIAHIYPLSLGQKGQKEQKEFWIGLQLFWAPEKIEAWKRQVLGPDGTETCSNLMCLVNLAHKLWEMARFALKPLSLSEDQSVLTVQFFWLPHHSYSHQMPAIKAPSPFPRSLSSIIVDGQPSATLFRIDTESKISSGDILTFKTDDPVDHPLPSMELLDMQWVLHRVLALSGAADTTDEELNPDSDMHLGLTSVYQEETEDSEEELEEEGEEEE
ncbi:HNH endonuclease signature motif containing protein [Aspergillus melleus]|uniref:HNH endonuclease signature motif containing protein n=1 Tax=Aspergillus melleus TaxID=138277 RepID=UPI001E8EE3DB|nr:uncharacterized protein LDX57_011367 [Aspergillus melleus]KAH8433733.1 hypothetical protein LDX57_011367 [Aspergillus melleus]